MTLQVTGVDYCVVAYVCWALRVSAGRGCNTAREQAPSDCDTLASGTDARRSVQL